jgi:4-hydroxybenzoate polyprenyltransferase
MIYIYLAIGIIVFLLLQFVSTRSVIDSNAYSAAKGTAWVSLPLWPIVLIFIGVGLLVFGACMAIEYIDNNIDRIIRIKK